MKHICFVILYDLGSCQMDAFYSILRAINIKKIWLHSWRLPINGSTLCCKNLRRRARWQHQMLNYIFTARSRASVLHMRCIHHWDAGYSRAGCEGFFLLIF